MTRFIILGISLLLSVSIFNHKSLLNQAPPKGDSQAQLQSVIENEKKTVKNELNAIENKTNTGNNELNAAGNQTNPVKNEPNDVGNKTTTSKNDSSVAGNQTSIVNNNKNNTNSVGNTTNTDGKSRLSGQAQPVLGNNTNKKVQPNGQSQPVVNDETNIVRNLVADFGKKLQMVSLSAPQDIAAQSIRENYRNYLSATLLAQWQKDPRKALGRLVSSPWPDRIEIGTMVKISDVTYRITGEIVEITSVEKVNGGFAAKRPVTLTVKKINNYWQIDEAIAGQYETSQAVVYKNTQYGFNFSLPESWKGYMTIEGQWQGIPIGEDRIVETGPEILIRHPLWTSENPRQDIPVMVFTLAQWNALQQEQFHIGAAPIGPSELGRNNKYVFALPARYNYAFPTGFQEVEEILNGKPLHTIDITK